ncbi:hypothetical protein MTR67_032151 [Solanum verrucosum]|uniref:Cardiolipin synthase N-terminal domain-containing protein n=2 Tax=Solanum TaxID=4107 RepID=A0AAF0U3U7_SOLVR|nr:uncharacterized protein LOC125812628 [Solanum verrucosum]WMV38766.1 hypothetical protein MTR67_032151 [Solanum verrucosum]
MIANSSLISSNFSTLLVFLRNHKLATRISFPNSDKIKNPPKTQFFNNSISGYGVKGRLYVCHSSLNLQNQQDPSMEKDVDGSTEENELGGGSNNGGNGDQWDRTTSFVLFGLWSGLMYYVFFLAPNQIPLTDMYFLKKLLNLKGDDGFQMNEVLVGLWYIMGLWPLVYSMLLLPTARSSKGSIPVWPFLVLSCFGGAYVLIPYFALWKPPPPPVEETELQRLPLNLLESKLTAGITMAAGLGIIFYAGLSSGDVWKEFYQYFRESRFIHAMSIDFSLLSAFAPFWIYNDMTARKWYDKGSWLLPLSVIPFLGPALYLLLRPSIPTVPALSSPTSTEEK